MGVVEAVDRRAVGAVGSACGEDSESLVEISYWVV